MNIDLPDKNSTQYKHFIEMVNNKVSSAMTWLENHNIEYVWNYQIDNHLYRLYIPKKDLLLDFETYPVNNPNYNYIRVNFDTNIITICERLFPETIIDTQELVMWKLNRRASNRFLRENGAAPIYNNSVLRLALVKDTTIYQCMIIKGDKVIANVVKQNCSVPYGTYILFRYLTEMFGFSEIQIKEDSGDSYIQTLYQLLNMKTITKTPKRKIWWSSKETTWRTDTPEEYIPFYLPEIITYQYSQEQGLRF